MSSKTPTTGRPRRRTLGFAGRILLFVVMLGVALGMWRYLGQGVGVTSPDWLTNATDRVQDLIDWARNLANNVGDG